VTRLTTGDIQGISRELPLYEASLMKKTGCSLRQLACMAAGVTEKDIQASMERAVIGLIPMTWGGGILEGFCETVAKIAGHIGCTAFVTRKRDAAGIVEAVEENAHILMFADEERFVALDMQRRGLVDNADATARGFVAGLHLMAGDLKDRNVLVLGCGPVGRGAVKALLKTGSRVSVYDIEPTAYARLSAELNDGQGDCVHFLNNLGPALDRHELIVDASPAADVIQTRHISAHSIVSAPGVPVGLDRSALAAIGDRLLHDPLQIGVATMLMDVLTGFRG
jgi:pyrrolysine biosynthesis protein PylD